MTVETNQATSGQADRTPTGISVAAGSVAVVAAAVVAAALIPTDDLPGRLVLMAVVVGGYAALVPDLRAVLCVSGLSVLVFTGFLANRYGELTTRHGAVWWYALAIAAAAALGIAYRRFRHRYANPPAPAVRRGTRAR